MSVPASLLDTSAPLTEHAAGVRELNCTAWDEPPPAALRATRASTTRGAGMLQTMFCAAGCTVTG
ncbi:hypothetical protein GY15_25840 [Delftia sp. 670]|nr:hypothetical protein GY15_25840 [Delftia sp. 670]